MHEQRLPPVKEVTVEQWRYGALCTNKGRMISNFLLTQVAANQHLLRMHAATIEAVVTTLKKFAPFYKGTVTDHTSDYVMMGLASAGAGTALDSLLQTVFANTPLDINSAKTTEQFTLIKLDAHRCECWIKKESAEKVWQQLSSLTTVVDESQWTLMNIRAGLGEVRKPTIEAWTPHMLNLQAVGAINFKKGCYTGQEIVARTEYRGQQKRAMYCVSGTGVAPETAAAILDGEQQAGEIVMAAPTHNHAWEALAVIADPHLDKPLQCNGQALQLLSLPYPFRKSVPAK
jgi:folate-binding protein YgfZ